MTKYFKLILCLMLVQLTASGSNLTSFSQAQAAEQPIIITGEVDRIACYVPLHLQLHCLLELKGDARIFVDFSASPYEMLIRPGDTVQLVLGGIEPEGGVGVASIKRIRRLR